MHINISIFLPQIGKKCHYKPNTKPCILWTLFQPIRLGNTYVCVCVSVLLRSAQFSATSTSPHLGCVPSGHAPPQARAFYRPTGTSLPFPSSGLLPSWGALQPHAEQLLGGGAPTGPESRTGASGVNPQCRGICGCPGEALSTDSVSQEGREGLPS